MIIVVWNVVWLLVAVQIAFRYGLGWGFGLMLVVCVPAITWDRRERSRGR